MMKADKLEPIIVFITASSDEEAKTISRYLVDEKLVACCNLISPIQSLFFWDGKVCNEQEVLLIAKTKRSRFARLVQDVKKLHSYDVPEIIALPIIEGSDDYLQWINDETA